MFQKQVPWMDVLFPVVTWYKILTSLLGTLLLAPLSIEVGAARNGNKEENRSSNWNIPWRVYHHHLRWIVKKCERLCDKKKKKMKKNNSKWKFNNAERIKMTPYMTNITEIRTRLTYPIHWLPGFGMLRWQDLPPTVRVPTWRDTTHQMTLLFSEWRILALLDNKQNTTHWNLQSPTSPHLVSYHISNKTNKFRE